MQKLMILGMLLAVPLAAMAVAGGSPDKNGGLTASVEIPAELDLSAGGSGPLVLEATASLTNQSSEPAEMMAPTPCHIHRWSILDQSGRQVHPKPLAICTQNVVQRVLPAGETWRDTIKLNLDPGKLAKGTSYRLRFIFWGIESGAEFTTR